MHPVTAPRGAQRYLPGSDSVKLEAPTANCGLAGWGAAAVVVVVAAVVEVVAAVVVVGTEVTGTIVGVETGLFPLMFEEWLPATM